MTAANHPETGMWKIGEWRGFAQIIGIDAHRAPLQAGHSNEEASRRIIGIDAHRAPLQAYHSSMVSHEPVDWFRL
jgi:hypothetical protein